MIKKILLILLLTFCFTSLTIAEVERPPAAKELNIQIESPFDPYICFDESKYDVLDVILYPNGLIKGMFVAKDFTTTQVRYVVCFVTRSGIITQAAFTFNGELYFMGLSGTKMKARKYGDMDPPFINWDLLEMDFYNIFKFKRAQNS